MGRLAEDTVLIAVVNKDKTDVVRKDPDLDDTRLRGLVLVEALTERWGVTRLLWGKRVRAPLKDARAHTSPVNPRKVSPPRFRPFLPHHLTSQTPSHTARKAP